MNLKNLSPLSKSEIQTSSDSLRIMIVSDAWHPQTNGVVRTLDTTASILSKVGYQIELVTPNRFQSTKVPFYPEIRLAHCSIRFIEEIVNRVEPNAIHIATEGPIGMAARQFALSCGLPFTTSYHTRFPEYLYQLLKVPLSLTYNALRWFHNPSSKIMVATQSIKTELEKLGFKNLSLWSRGVNIKLFHPRPDKRDFLSLTRPIFLNVGRVSKEKNLEAFLDLNLPGTKVIVGDGPMLDSFRAKYPNVVFTGAKHGEELASIYAASDVFVFPSKTDTFGNVILEALASGLPVAAYPVPGPIDILGNSKVGFLNSDLQSAVMDAYNATISKSILEKDCFLYVKENYTWIKSTKQFLSNLVMFNNDVSKKITNLF